MRTSLDRDRSAKMAIPATFTLVGRKFLMKWVKPKFEIVDLCSEVTSYLYHR